MFCPDGSMSRCFDELGHEYKVRYTRESGGEGMGFGVLVDTIVHHRLCVRNSSEVLHVVLTCDSIGTRVWSSVRSHSFQGLAAVLWNQAGKAGSTPAGG